MQRRKFIKNTGMIAVGVGVFGNISWDKERFIGDTLTTTDILGPFYRPNAPIRTNINPAGYSGKLFHLSGTVFKEDGKTPFPNSMVEIWQADENKKYDNTSDEFLYRGSQRVSKSGKYHFITVHPIPYPVDDAGAFYRPAHIHMRISGEGQQDLITQIYFKDDPYLEKDPFAGSPEAVSRILKISENSRQEEMVQFNVVMQKEFKPGKEVFDKLSGIYTMSDKSMMEFYKDGDMLFVKWNGQIIAGISYKGNNTFGGGANELKAVFELQAGGSIKVKVDYPRPVVATSNHLEGVKIFKY